MAKNCRDDDGVFKLVLSHLALFVVHIKPWGSLNVIRMLALCFSFTLKGFIQYNNLSIYIYIYIYSVWGEGRSLAQLVLG